MTSADSEDLITQRPADPKFPKAAEIAAAMIAKDRHIIAALLLFCALPQIVWTLIGGSNDDIALTAAILSSLAELIAFALLARRWFRRADSSPAVAAGSTIIFIFAALLISLALKLPFILLPIAGLPILPFIGLCAFVWLGYYFYFAPLLVGIRNPLRVAVLARSFTKDDWSLPIKTVLPGIAFWNLAAAICTLISPDHRQLWAALIFQSAPALFWIPSCYLSIAATVTCAPETTLRELGLSPRAAGDRDSKYGTIRQVFAPKRAAALALAALLLRAAGEIHALSLAPAPTIKIVRAESRGTTAEVELRLADSEYHFRGFSPRAFSLGSAQGTFIGLVPDIRSGYSPEPNQNEWNPTLSFNKIRHDGDITQLEDLFLWYKGYKAAPIKFTKGPAVEDAPGKTSDSAKLN